MKLTVTKKIGLILLIPAIGALLAIGVFYWFHTQTDTDAAFINVAGRQRMLAQQLFTYAHMVRTGMKDDRQGLRALVDTFDQSLRVLEQGGQAMGRSLPPAPEEVMDEIASVKRLWRKHKEALLLIAEGPTAHPQAKEAYQYVQSKIPLLTEASDRVVAAYEAWSRALRTRMLNTLIAIAAFDLFLLFAGIWVIHRYVAERKRSQAEMLKLSSVTEQTDDSVVITDRNGLIEYVNQAFEKSTGFSRDEALGKKPNILKSGRHNRDFYENIWKVVLRGEVFRGRLINRKKDGSLFYEEKTITPLKDSQGNITHFVATGKDITEQKQAEKALGESHRLLEALSHSQSEFISHASTKDVFGKLLENLLSLTDSEHGFIGEILYAADGRPYLRTHAITNIAWNDETREFYEKNAPNGLEFRNIKTLFGAVMATGEPVISNDPYNDPRRGGLPKGHPPLNAFLGLPFYSGDALVGMVGIANRPGGYDEKTADFLKPFLSSCGTMIDAWRNALRRKLAEEAFRAANILLEKTFASLDEAVFVVDANTRMIISCNAAVERIFGYSKKETVGRNTEFLHVDKERYDHFGKELSHALNGNGVYRTEFQMRRKDGTVFHTEHTVREIADDSGRRTGLVSVVRDITDRKRMEEERLRASKLESVGILAGGIAHDFNNILTVVIGNLSLAKELSSPEEEAYPSLADAEKAALRAKGLTQQLLSLSKGGAPIKKSAPIAELIKESAGFALRGSNVRCEFSPPSDLWPVEVDEGQMSQVMNNLMINANQAMPEGGVIEVRCGNVALEDPGAESLPLQRGRYVKISIRDHGVGMPAENLEKIFDPYFSTKQEGTGLGLATTYSIVKHHGGHIGVQSELGVGTTFHIYLPAASKAAPHPKESEERFAAGRGQGKILIMDDDEAVRELVARILKHIGYEVESARDGNETIERYREAEKTGQPFGAVIMDLTVPGGMGGKEAIRELIEIDPQVKVIVSSGYAADPIMAEFKKYGFSGVVAKPFRAQRLAEVLSKVLGEKG